MQLPFNLNDVRMISIDGPTIRFVLKNGHVEITLDSRKEMNRLQQPVNSGRIPPSEHIMFDDGIYGI
jgi:hypothetical protein